MNNRHPWPPAGCIPGSKLTLPVAIGLLMMTSGCAKFSQPHDASLTDEAMRLHVEEWRQVKPSIERLAALEGDLSILLAEVSTMSDITQTPGLPIAGGFKETELSEVAFPPFEPMQKLDAASAGQELNDDKRPIAVASYGSANSSAAALLAPAVPTEPSAPPVSASSSVPPIPQVSQPSAESLTPLAGDTSNTAVPTATEQTHSEASCATQYAGKFRKSLALTYFPRTQPATSSAGYLHQVDQHLPLLLNANLKTRHGFTAQSQIPSSISSVKHQGEYPVADHVKNYSRQHKSQFLITGEIHDMSLVSPELAYARGPYNHTVKSVINLINRNGLNTQSRVFKFKLQVRDGFNGQLVFDEVFQTMGKWDADKPNHIGFGSALFWQTDYGQKVQHLVAEASDKLAATLACQPFTAHADVSPGTRQIVVHGGANNGFEAGDTLTVYRIEQHPIPGEYLRYHSSVVGTKAMVSLLNVYPNHSIAQSNQDLSQFGSFLVREP